MALLAGILIAARLAAPALIKYYINRALESSPTYRGNVSHVQMSLYRGAYQVDNVVIAQIGTPDLSPLFTCARVDLSIGWRQLMHGAVVGRISIYSPTVTYAESGSQNQLPKPTAPAAGSPEAVTWQQKVEKLFPFSIDEVRVIDGTLRYEDPSKKIDLPLGKIQAVITNLTNSVKESRAGNRVASIKAEGAMIGGGDLSLSGNDDPYAAKATFHILMSLKHVDLVALNPLIEAYEQLTVKHGTLDFFIDAQSYAGALKGYAKPLLTNLSIYSPQDLKKKGMHALREAVVGAADKILKNHGKDSFATTIPIQGNLNDPDTSVKKVLIGVLKNGFIHALMPSFDPDRKNLTPEQDAHASTALNDTKNQAAKGP